MTSRMPEQVHAELDRWLEAERRQAEDAEAAFSALWSARVPVLAPSKGFEDRVVSEAMRRAGVPAVPVWLLRPVQVLMTLTLIFAALALASVTSVDLFGLLGTATSRVLSLGLAAVATLEAWTSAGVHAWSLAAALGRAAALASATGVAPLVLTVNLLVAAASFYGLKRLLAPREECW